MPIFNNTLIPEPSNSTSLKLFLPIPRTPLLRDHLGSHYNITKNWLWPTRFCALSAFLPYCPLVHSSRGIFAPSAHSGSRDIWPRKYSSVSHPHTFILVAMYSSRLLSAGPVIIAGVALGIEAVVKAGSKHLDDTHKVCFCLPIIFYSRIDHCLRNAD
jgi:hypothetical protein